MICTIEHPGVARSCNCGVGRRSFLRGAVAGGVLAATGFHGTARAATSTGWVDVHNHLVPPAWLATLDAAKLATPPVTNWTPRHSLDDMDRGGVATAILSPTTPQVSFLDAPTAAKVARESNDWARKLADDHPGRFGV